MDRLSSPPNGVVDARRMANVFGWVKPGLVRVAFGDGTEEDEEIQLDASDHGHVVKIPGSVDFGGGGAVSLVPSHLRPALVAEHHGHLEDALERSSGALDGVGHIIDDGDAAFRQFYTAAHGLEFADECLVLWAATGTEGKEDQVTSTVLYYPARK
ncbi:MAG: hypothetical protein Q9164_006505 [Protoblastenia rupestris]